MTKGYKAMNPDLSCKGVQFEIGQTYDSPGDLKMCSNGFHFCENPFDVYNYYPKEVGTIICEIEALGEIQKEENKSVTNKIKIIRQLNDKEILEIWIKRTNSGYGNSGNRNSGYGNSGDRNSGNWNSGDGNSGYFCSQQPKLILFDKPTNVAWTPEFDIRTKKLNVKPICEWISETSMTEVEKTQYPSYKTTGGYLKKPTAMIGDTSPRRTRSSFANYRTLMMKSSRKSVAG